MWTMLSCVREGEVSYSKTLTLPYHSKCSDTARSCVLGIILTKVLYPCLWMCIIFSSPTNSAEASDAFILGHKCSAVQCIAQFSLTSREGTRADFPSGMEVSSALTNLSELSLQSGTYLRIGVWAQPLFAPCFSLLWLKATRARIYTALPLASGISWFSSVTP